MVVPHASNTTRPITARRMSVSSSVKFKNHSSNSLTFTLRALASFTRVLNIVSNIRHIEDFCGPYIGYEMVASVQVVESTRKVYYVMNYEKCPVFGRVTAYKTAQGEVITEFNFHANIGEIIPRELIFKK